MLKSFFTKIQNRSIEFYAKHAISIILKTVARPQEDVIFFLCKESI